MRVYRFIVIVISLMTVSVQATTIKRKISRETICGCMGVYARFSFEVADGVLTNIKLIDSSSKKICDIEYMDRLAHPAGSGTHPDGVEGIGVIGYTAKDKTMSYEQCLKTDEVEFDLYWFVEDVLIDLDKIN